MWLAGCAGGPIGKDFARPDPATTVLGQTTQAEILQRYGEPRSERSETRALRPSNEGVPGEQGLATWVDYVFVPDPEGRSGILRRKELTFVFWNHRVVSYRFASTFPDDRTDFAEARIAEVVRGQTTRDEATRLLGEPTGMSIYPVTPSRELRYLTYTYVEHDAERRTRVVKRLALHLDPNDVVVDNRLETRTDPYRAPAPMIVPVPIPIPLPR
jgi:hypothetical protein